MSAGEEEEGEENNRQPEITPENNKQATQHNRKTLHQWSNEDEENETSVEQRQKALESNMANMSKMIQQISAKIEGPSKGHVTRK
jgi:hypothetical protein